jgi:hypothetical protein
MNLPCSHSSTTSFNLLIPGGVYGIQNAGLAIAVGTWSSIIVLTSFFFGMFVFHERVKHLGSAFVAFLCLIFGLIGMSRYAAHPPDTQQLSCSKSSKSTLSSYNSMPVAGLDDEGSIHRVSSSPALLRPAPRPVKRTGSNNFAENTSAEFLISSYTKAVVGGSLEIEMEPLVDNDVDDNDDETLIMDNKRKDASKKDHVVLLGGRLSLTRRQLGVLGAVVNGAWGGLNLIPMHYAQKYDGIYGSAYVISFATGAMIVQIAVWIGLFVYQYYQKKEQWQDALDALPKFHLRELWAPGLMAGLLYSIGNFTAILTVAALGQSIGYPFCQMQLFVSGCWGIFYFKEVKGYHTIAKWFLSATLALVGIVWLAYEREGSSGH